MRIVKINKNSASEAASVLRRGGLVIYPTETLYGIGADATNQTAVDKLNVYKERPTGKPYSIAVADQNMAEKFVVLNQTAKDLYKKFLPGPVTVISTGKHKMASGVESETGTLGVRITDYPLVTEIVKKLGKPITATSANPSYKKRPYKVSDIVPYLSARQKGLIDLIIDAGSLPMREPSTVIDTTADDPVVLRQGEIRLKDKVEILSRSEENTQNIAKELYQKYEKYLGKRPVLFALEGEMGAGKTQFAKGLGRAMEIADEILSPTFNLVLSYRSKGNVNKLTHIDAWRLQNSSQLDELGFTKIIEEKNMVIAIEWADRVIGAIKKYRSEAVIIWVKIKYGTKENERLITWGNM